MGVTGLKRIQIGKETTDAHGTMVAATAVLRFEGSPKEDTELTEVKEDIGYSGGIGRAYAGWQAASFPMSGPLTFEQAPYLFNANVDQKTPTTDSGSGYIWSWSYPFTNATTMDVMTATLQGGDNIACEKVPHAYIPVLNLSGKSGEAWMVDAPWRGSRIVDTDDFTTASDCTLTDPVEEILFSKTKLYIDATSDTLGNTLKSSVLLSAEIELDGGWVPLPIGDGNTYYSSLKNIGAGSRLRITFEHAASVKTEKQAKRGEPRNYRQIRLIATGNALGTAGGYTYKTLRIDMAGYWASFSELSNQDGDTIATGEFVVCYRTEANAAAGMGINILLVNEVSAIP